PALHRSDVLVAEDLLQSVRGPGRAVAGGAVEDHAARLVGDRPLDPRLEIAPGHVDRAGNVGLVPLVLLAHVDDDRAVAGAVFEGVVHLWGIALGDPLLDLADDVGGVGHYYRKCSGSAGGSGGALNRRSKRYRGALSDAPAKTQTSLLRRKLDEASRTDCRLW